MFSGSLRPISFLVLQCTTMNRLRSYPLARKGFTLIELLVVVAIIAVLASVILVSFSDVRLKSRDAKRLSDMREIEKALALYHDNNRAFPIAVSTITITSDDVLSTALEGDAAIANVPVDPLHDTYTYTYRSDISGSTFTLSFCLEGTGIANFSQGCGNIITP